MIEGQGTKTYNLCKKIMYSNPEFLHKILRKVTDVVKFYLEKQIEAGADVVQIFDSWAAAIEPGRYDEFSWKYMVNCRVYKREISTYSCNYVSKRSCCFYRKRIGLWKL